MLIAILSGFIVPILLIFTARYIKGWLPVLLSLLPLGLFVYFCSFIQAVSSNGPRKWMYEWVPSLGIDLGFYLDGLSLVFALMITGVGTLVFIYTSAYMKSDPNIIRFYAYLSMFMSAMLGIVMSDNIFSLITFWELTSITSFFLIGFNNTDPAARRSSLIALSITGGGGFLLLAGFVLLSYITGTTSINQMIGSGDIIKDSGSYVLILILIITGAFTKSAQFPFHFWLPAAMKAPTPVSTYLHSATMVKAGIYLLARFTPILGDHEYWNNTLTIAGGITMVFAAVQTMFYTDLKIILAYSTISALGMLVFLLGLGTPEAFLAVAVFILIHAIYKAALFLITGIIDHETGTRDVTRLSGLRKVMWPVAIAGLLAAISSAGLPLTFGFVGKELIYEATWSSKEWAILLTAVAVVTNVLLLYAGMIAGFRPFAGSLPADYRNLHMPSKAMWIPPLLLGILGIIYGFNPGIIDQSLVKPFVASLEPREQSFHLSVWHGFNTVLLLSGITLLAGGILYMLVKPSMHRDDWIQKFSAVSPANLFLLAGNLFRRASAKYTNTLQNGYLRVYVLTILIFLIGLLAYRLARYVDVRIDLTGFSEITFFETMVIVIMMIAIIFTIISKSRLLAVASMGVVGYCICLIFVFYSAPDLATTQFTIDTLTVVLFVLVLYRLPGYLVFKNNKAKLRDAVVSSSLGVLITIIVLQVLQEPLNRETSEFYADNAYLLAKGKNIVNVIIVDFRGVDTLIEITVLAIAALGVYSLLKLKVKLPGGE